MTKRVAAVLILAGIVLAVSRLGSGGKIAAVVNGELITTQQVEERMSRLNPSARAAIKNDPKRLLQEMITETILLQEARRRGLERDLGVRELLKEAKRQILLGRLLEVVRESAAVEVTAQEVSQFYQENEKRFVEPDTFRASHILVAEEAMAKNAIERVKKGEPFAKVAEELSLDVSKERGGDIGFFTKGQLFPEFEAACEEMKPGELSPVVKTPLGYHVILLTERKASRQVPLEEAQDQIRSKIAAAKKQQSLENSVHEIRQKAQIRIRPPFAVPALATDQPKPAQTQSPNS